MRIAAGVVLVAESEGTRAMILAALSPESQLAIIVGSFAAIQAVIGGAMLIVQWLMNRSDKREAAAREERIGELAREDQRMARGAMNLAAIKTAEVASAAMEVKETLATTTAATDKKLEQIYKTAEDTHTLVNANMGIALGVNMDVTRRLAELTKGTPNGKADEVAAKKAEEMYRAHEAKQATVDAAGIKKA